MSLDTLIWEAELHREIYAAILTSALARRGAKEHLARLVGITPQHLSYILVTDRDPENLRAIRRTPSEALCRRIAAALPLSS